MTSTLDGVGAQRHAPAAIAPGKFPVPIVQEAGCPQGPFWIGEKNLAPPTFDPRTVQPVASRYTNWAIPAPKIVKFLHFSRHIFRMYSGIMFHNNLPSAIQVVPRGRTDMTKIILAFQNSV